MLNKTFFKNVILFTVIVGGALLALYLFDTYHPSAQTKEANLDAFIEGESQP